MEPGKHLEKLQVTDPDVLLGSRWNGDYKWDVGEWELSATYKPGKESPVPLHASYRVLAGSLFLCILRLKLLPEEGTHFQASCKSYMRKCMQMLARESI